MEVIASLVSGSVSALLQRKYVSDAICLSIASYRKKVVGLEEDPLVEESYKIFCNGRLRRSQRLKFSSVEKTQRKKTSRKE